MTAEAQTLPAPYAARHIDAAPSMFLLVSTIDPSSFNPRKTFPHEALAELAASLKQHGMLSPLVVRPAPGGRYAIVAGERRWRAAQLAGIESVPARIVELDDRAALELAIVENVLRADLDPIEEANGYAALRDTLGMRQTAIAAAVKRSQPTVARALGLLKLPEDVQALIAAGQLSVSHGEALAPYTAFPKLVSAIAGHAVAEHWPTRQMEDKPHAHWAILQHAERVVYRLFAAEFDTSVCQQCPFNAFRADGSGRPGAGYCLRPDHYDELEAQAKSALAAKVAAMAAVQPGGAQHVLDLRTVPASSAQDLRCCTVPDTCTAACPCRVAALDRWGNATQACTDPARFEKLRKAADRAKTAARNTLTRARLAEARRRLDAAPSLGQRELVLLASIATMTGARHKAKEAAATRAGLQAYPTSREYMAAHMTAEQVMRVAVDALLTSSAFDACDNNYADSGLLNWYVNGWQPGETHASTERTTTEGACSACGASMELAGEDLADPVSALCAECAG